MTALPDLCFVVTCMGRLAHLQQSLPRLAMQAGSECILVDYSCPDHCGARAEAAFPGVRVVRVPGQRTFNLARARNAGAAAATAPWLCFVDADVLVAPRFAEALRPLLQPRLLLRASPLVPELWGTHVVPAEDWRRVGGYDECFAGWGGEDVDFFARLGDAGCASAAFPAWLLESLGHDDAARVRFHDVKDRQLSRHVNTLYRHAKQDMVRISGAYLSEEVRTALHREAGRALAGGPGRLSVGLGRRNLTEDMAMEVRLQYTLTRREPAPLPAPPAPLPPPAPVIVGTGDCGSTLLRLMLDRHPDLAVAADTHFLPDLLQIWNDVPQAIGPMLGRLVADPAWAAYGIDAEELAAHLRAGRIGDPGGFLRAFYSRHAASHGKTRWGDRTLDHLAHMGRLAEWLPEARFIHLVRDGRDVAAAGRAAVENPPPVAATAARWAATLGVARAFNPGPERYIEVRYEDLVAAPEATLRRICAFIDLPWHPALLEYGRIAPARMAETEALARRGGPPAALLRRQYLQAAGSPDGMGVGAWRQGLGAEERAQFRLLAGPFLDSLGYPAD